MKRGLPLSASERGRGVRSLALWVTNHCDSVSVPLASKFDTQRRVKSRGAVQIRNANDHQIQRNVTQRRHLSSLQSCPQMRHLP